MILASKVGAAMKLVKYMIPLILVAGLVAWIAVAESVFIRQEKPITTKSVISKLGHNDPLYESVISKLGHNDPLYELFIQEEEEPTTREIEEEEKEALLRFRRSVAELFAKTSFGTKTFGEEFNKILSVAYEDTAKIQDKRVKLGLEKDIHIPDISVEDKQVLRYIMSNCVDQYFLITSTINHLVPLPHNVSDYGVFCVEFFSKIEKFNGSLHKLKPAHVAALKEYYYARSAS